MSVNSSFLWIHLRHAVELFFFLYSLGVMPVSRLNILLKYALPENPVRSAISVMDSSSPVSAASRSCALLTR